MHYANFLRYTYLTAVDDADVIEATADTLVDMGVELDDDLELTIDIDYEGDCEAAVEIEDKWCEVQYHAMARVWERADDDERMALWHDDAAGQDPEDPVDAEGIWDLMRTSVMEACGDVQGHGGMAMACMDALRVTSAEALARVLTCLESVRVSDAAMWGRTTRARVFDVADGCVVVWDESRRTVRHVLRLAFADVSEAPEGAEVIELLGDARDIVGL